MGSRSSSSRASPPRAASASSSRGSTSASSRRTTPSSGRPRAPRRVSSTSPTARPPGRPTRRTPVEGGVPIGNLPVKVAYAIKYREMNFLLSDAVNADSRLLDHRTPRDRVQRVAPWLTLDGNAYPAVVDNKVQWIVDGYTTTADYPNSHLTSIEQATSDSITTTRTSVQAVAAGQVNYIRNSVKATVDAYDGTVHLYAWDDSDPMLKAWMGAFPGTVQPMSDISAGLMAAPALPRGPVQGAARDPRPLPRHRPGHLLRQQRPLEGAVRPHQGPAHPGRPAALLPVDRDARSGRAAVLVDDDVHAVRYA